MTTPRPLVLIVRRVIAATPEKLFEAWTTPSQLMGWWGPPGARCTRAEVDLHLGGRYRIHNELRDGRVLVITGEFVHIEPPTKLVYSWRLEPADEHVSDERVTVQFVARSAQTEVIVTHERIPGKRQRDEHEVGWNGCLQGLASFLEGDVAPRSDRKV